MESKNQNSLGLLIAINIILNVTLSYFFIKDIITAAIIIGATTAISILLFKKNWKFLLVLILAASFIINASVTITTPIIFGDEGLYASRGAWIWETKQIPQYYHIQSESEAFKSYFIRPPYMMTLLASVFGIGGEFLVKAFLPFVNVMTAMLLFLFVKKIFSEEAGILAALSLVIMPSFITYTVLLYVEAVLVLFVTASMYFLYLGLTENRKRHYLISGACAGMAALTDVGGFIMPILYFFILLYFQRQNPHEFGKKFSTLLLIFFVIIGPWFFLHNYLQANTFGIPVLDSFTKGSSVVILKEIPQINEGSRAFGGLGGGGTSDSIIRMGVINYVEFAYTQLVVLLASIGLLYMLMNRKKTEVFIIVWLVLVLGINYYLSSNGRAEDSARALLVTATPLAVLAGLSSEKIYSSLKNAHNIGAMIAIVFVAIMVVWTLNATNAKAQSLKPIKQFSPSFFQACDWIKENTEKGSLLATVWQHRAEYACRRDTVWIGDPGIDQAVLARNSNTTQIFKLHGADYIFVQKFSVRPGNEAESYPVDFVNFIANSPDYKLAYETEQNCLGKGEVADCSMVYKVL